METVNIPVDFLDRLENPRKEDLLPSVPARQILFEALLNLEMVECNIDSAGDRVMAEHLRIALALVSVLHERASR